MDPAPQPPGVVEDTRIAEARFVRTETDVAREPAEQALRASEERFRQMAEHIQQVFWMSNSDLSQILYVSPAYARIWGRSCASLSEQPMSFLEAVHPDDRERVRVNVLEKRLTPGPEQGQFDIEYRIVRPDGEVRWIRAQGFPVRGPQGQLERVAGCANDITDRKRAQEEIEQRRQEADVLAELARNVNASLDLDTVLIRVAAGARMLCHSDMASLSLRDPHSEAMIVRYWDGLHTPESAALRVEPGQGVGGQVLVTGQPFRTDHYASDPRVSQDFCHVAFLQDIVAVMAVPIWISARMEGLLHVANCTPWSFTDHDEAILQRLAEHTAIAIRNARLYQQQAQRQAELRTLLDINKQIGQTSALAPLLDTIAREAARLLDVPVAIVRQREGDDLVLASFWGKAVEMTLRPRLKIGERLGGLVASSRQPVIVDDVSHDDRISPENLAFRRRYGLLASLGVPLIAGDEILGILTFLGRTGRHFSPADAEMALAFADQAAIAIQRAQLYTQAERRRAAAESLTDVTRLLSQSLDPEEVGQRIVDAIRRLLGAKAALLYQQESPSVDLHLMAVATDGASTVDVPRVLPQGTNVAGLAVRARRPMVSSDVLADPRLTLTPELRAYFAQLPPRTVLSVPLLLDDEVIGVLSIGDDAGREFSMEEMHLVQAFATQAATALHNARLYQQQTHREEEVRTLLEINKTLGQVRELPDLLSAIAAEAARLLAVPEVTFRLCEGNALRLVGAWRQTETEPLLTSLPIEGTLNGWVVQNGVPLIINDLERDDRVLPATRVRLIPLGYVAYLGVPLRLGAEVVGVMTFSAARTRPFTDHDQEVAVAFADQAAIAVQHAQLYAQLQQAYDDLQQTQQLVVQQERLRALGQMASGIAHDINNALSPVALYVEVLLRSDPTLSTRAREYLTTVEQAVQDVAHTIERLREFSRPPASLQEALPVDLNQIVPQVVDLTRARWRDQPQQRGITITLHTVCAENLPRVRGIDSELREALINLVFNAIDAMPQGGTLTLQTRATPTAVLVEVIDTGIGMDEMTRQRCLEPFYTTKGERGTGLGLAMVYGVLERHAAQLVIESAVGQGTTMRLLLPIAPGDSDQPAQPAEIEERPALLRILVIDDDPLLRQSLQDVLQIEGHVVTVAEGGVAGLAAFRIAQIQQEPFSVVITDLGMPGMDGREVARVVKQTSPQTPVILLTGWGETLRREGSVPPHVDHLLSKPPKLSDLRAALVTVAESRGGRTGHDHH